MVDPSSIWEINPFANSKMGKPMPAQRSPLKRFTVMVNTKTNEVLEGKEDLEKYMLFIANKINRKEQDIINIRELAESLALDEANRMFIKFDASKHSEEMQKLYKKHYKNIIKFRNI